VAPRTFGALLAERRAALVGRDGELAALVGVLDEAGPLAAIVHGVAGAGKTALLHAFRTEAVARGVTAVAIDGRAIEPTEHGFRAALDAGHAAQEDAEHGRLTVLVVDAAERLRLIEGWLLGELLPSLPAHVRVVLATRDAPRAIWRASFGELLRTVPLGPLAPADATEVLRRAGLDDRQAAWVNRFTRGHPLSLQLAASAVLARPDAPEDAILPTVVQELAALYLDGLDSATREALDATSVLRRVTLSLLGALVPGAPPQEVFARLAALPFVELGREGLVVHDAVREAVLALLRAADPVRHRAYRAAAWRQIRSEMAGAAAGAPRWASVADMLALVEEPLVREAFFPASVQHYAVERARPGDRGAIEAIAARHETPEEIALVRAWWESVPQAFRVARDPRGRIVAFTVLAELGDVPRRLLDDDPVCEPWRRHMADHAVPAGQQVLLARQALAHGTGAATSPCLAALLRDLERASLELGPAVRRIYSMARDALLPQIAPIGFAPLPVRAVVHGGRSLQPTMLDLGPESVAGWVSRLAADDPSVDDARLDGDGRELVLDGRRIALTKLECAVLTHLREREGRPVARETLLRDVWGYEWTGGSNVVEVAVSGLRRKLGDRAGAIETVRGVGYRLRGL
jgi:hypothetical protein